MIAVTYKITLEQPVLVTSLNGDPNSAVAFDYIPGSVVRGLLIGREQAAVEPEDADIRRRYFDSNRFLNAYPLVGNTRLLPTPASWRKPKRETFPAYDLATDDNPNVDQQLVRVKVPFQGESAGTHYLAHPERYLNIHINRGNRQRGRADENEGAVYRYDALAAGQVFAGVVLCDEADADTIMKNLPGTAFVGGARTGGYGRVQIDLLDKLNWEPTSSGSETLMITALSDVLLRDRYGGYVTGGEPVAAWVSRLLDRNVALKSSFDSVTEIGGFNRKWGLPLTQASAIMMGSVFVFAGDFSQEDIQKLETAAIGGIGDRTVDGFGQIAINLRYPASFDVTHWEPGQAIMESDSLSDTDHENAQQMLQRIYRQQQEAQLVQQANQLVQGMDVSRIPNPSQLAQLRAIAHAQGATPKHIGEFQKVINDRKDARTQFERFRIDGQPFWDWFDKVKPTHAAPDHEIGNVKLEPSDQDQQKYKLRLLDEILARAIRKKKEAS